MTLIVTHIDKFGIVHASDSNLTSHNQTVGEGTKVFGIPNLNAGLSIAGSYSVGSNSMADWMPDFIIRQSEIPGINLNIFSHNLKTELEKTMTSDEKKGGSIIHIAGYVTENGLSHPEFWFVRNIHRIDQQTGYYKDIDDKFEISEDFWTRDCQAETFSKSWADPTRNAIQTYFNGFSPGRIGYYAVSSELRRFFNYMWNNKSWKFRPPQSIEETEILLKNYMQIIDTLFVLSEYKARYIGGTIQTLVIKPPSSLAGQI